MQIIKLIVSCGGDNSGLVRVDAVECLGKDLVSSDCLDLKLDREIRICWVGLLD